MWYLDQNALIMNPDLTIEGHIMNPKRLESLMIRDQSIVPPDSVIKTFPHLKGTQIDMVITQDEEGLAQGSFIIRRGDWSKFFLDTWFDPLYRSYNFQKADTHALVSLNPSCFLPLLMNYQEHIVQWHPTILSKLALVPQRIMNAYPKGHTVNESETYKDGDFIIRFAGCEQAGRSCATEAEPFSKQWRTVFRGP
jgi:mannan polymerase II complex MNN11 subunit